MGYFDAGSAYAMMPAPRRIVQGCSIATRLWHLLDCT
jgi:hypothetical protein